MKRSTYMFIALVVLGYALVPFMVDRDNKYELSSYRIEGEYVSKDFLQKSNIVICGNTQHLRYSTKTNVIIEAYEGDSIRCEYESDWGKYLSFDTNNDTLEMKVLFDKMREMEGLGTYFELYSNDIKLKVPRKMLKVVDASKLSRHLNLTLLNFDDDRLETKSRGKLTLKDCKIKDVTLKSYKGNLHLNGETEIDNVYVKMSDSKVYMAESKVTKMYAEGEGEIYISNADVKKIITEGKCFNEDLQEIDNTTNPNISVVSTRRKEYVVKE